MNPKKLQAVKDMIDEIYGHDPAAEECKQQLAELEAQGLLENDCEGLKRKMDAEGRLDAPPDVTVH